MPDFPRPESSMSLRPASISQPNVPASLDLNTVPSELQLVLGLLSLQAQRPYCDGYVLRKHVSMPDGKPAPDQEWYEFFAQLNGTILSLWDATAVDEAAYQGSQTVMPQFINITDAIITSSNPQENPDHQHILSISTAGSNRYLFEFQNHNVLKRWSAAFRVAMFERAALQECYTAALIARSRTASGVKRLFSAYHGALGSKGKYSGWVRVRFSWSIKWQKCWAVVSDTPSSWFAGSGHGLHERLLYKFSSKQSLRGEVRFYESRRDPKNKPIAILGNVYAAYAVYPEKPFLVDSSTLIKVEGSLLSGRGNSPSGRDQFKDAFVLLMPDDMPASSSNNSSPNSSPVIGPSAFGSFSSGTSQRARFASSGSSLLSALAGNTTKSPPSAAFESMLTWLVAFYDAFNLYGRPDKLITDNSHRESMIFAMPSTLEDAYLDVEEVFLALADNGNLENNTYSCREWRQKMKELTLEYLREGKKVFNPAVLLRNTVAEVPVIRPPVPPHLREPVDTTGAPIRAESAPVVSFTEPRADSALPIPYPSPTARQPQGPRHPPPPPHMQHKQLHPQHPPPPLQQQPQPPAHHRLGFLRRKPSKQEPDPRSRSFSADGLEQTRVAMNRFSLNEDSEDDAGPDIFAPSTRSSYQASPLRNSQVRPPTSESEEEAVQKQVHVDRPSLMKRMSSHRRGHSETRMVELHREAEENRKGYASDEESDKPRHARRVSSDDMLKVQVPVANSGRLSRGSDETGTQFNNTFDDKEPVSRVRISESSSDRSETPADPLHDTPRMDAVHLQSSPASSMESLPPPKPQTSPMRGHRSIDERMYNATIAPPEHSFNAPLFRDQSAPSVLLPINGQPIPVRREPSPNQPQQMPPPRSAPWSGVNAIPLGPSARVNDVIQHNQELLRPREHRPAPSPTAAKFDPNNPYPSPSPTTAKFGQPLGYPAQPPGPRPQQYPTGPNMGQSYNMQNIPLRARGPPQPYPPMDLRAKAPMIGPPPQGNRVPRRPPPQSDMRLHPGPPPAAAAAARSAYSSNPPDRSPSPGQRPGYPQGPRQITS